MAIFTVGADILPCNAIFGSATFATDESVIISPMELPQAKTVNPSNVKSIVVVTPITVNTDTNSSAIIPIQAKPDMNP
eukprot:CAMPEP_0114668316 /NCGR_PEP_ID=MMETSP0191-20121206/36011_1 /TAXON_ID=126664 /ORGANISM="Sorites sp." /LENGTH=77 /DNA_ID=CAMNT_0001920987 /DNA_START=121 /DNA_END=351 /DNA_ORIENTATION=+